MTAQKEGEANLQDRFHCKGHKKTDKLVPHDRSLIENLSNKFRTSLMSGTAFYAKPSKMALQAGDIYRVVSCYVY